MKKIYAQKKSLAFFVMLIVFINISKHSTASCHAGFTWTQSSANHISFTSTSTGTIFNWGWNFGDGQSIGGGTLNPVHIYNMPGTYYVCLSLYDSSGMCDRFCDSVTVTGGIHCGSFNAYASEQSFASCGTCNDGSAIVQSHGGALPYTYSWSTMPVQTTITATNLSPGTYTVCVLDTNGCSACATVQIDTCNAFFTWAQSAANTIDFHPSLSGSFTFWRMDFGDGTSSFYDTTHFYNIPGTYWVCNTYSDSFATCTYCDSVTVTGTITCNFTVHASVTQYATCGTCADGSASANTTGGSGPFTYFWTTSPVQTTQTAVNLLPGTYTVCATDTNNCSACASVTVDSIICHANFTWAQTATNTITFTNTSATNHHVSNFWDFGDGSSAYSWNTQTVHHYNSAGTYTVCLIINSDTSQIAPCHDTICMPVTVTGITCNLLLALSENDATCPSCNNGSASSTVTGGTSPYTYHWNTGSSSSAINGLFPGVYTLCVTDANACTACSSITVSSPPSSCTSYFTLVADSIIPHTYWATNYATGTPPISYTWEWGDGTYSYTAYPSHTYASAGYYQICLIINDSTPCRAVYCDTTYLHRREQSLIYVNVISPMTNIKENNGGAFSIFPNPASDNITIEYYLTSARELSMDVFDIIGNKITTISGLSSSAGEHSLKWNTSALPRGIYLLQLKTGGGVISKRIAIVR